MSKNALSQWKRLHDFHLDQRGVLEAQITRDEKTLAALKQQPAPRFFFDRLLTQAVVNRFKNNKIAEIDTAHRTLRANQSKAAASTLVFVASTFAPLAPLNSKLQHLSKLHDALSHQDAFVILSSTAVDQVRETETALLLSPSFVPLVSPYAYGGMSALLSLSLSVAMTNSLCALDETISNMQSFRKTAPKTVGAILRSVANDLCEETSSYGITRLWIQDAQKTDRLDRQESLAEAGHLIRHIDRNAHKTYRALGRTLGRKQEECVHYLIEQVQEKLPESEDRACLVKALETTPAALLLSARNIKACLHMPRTAQPA